MLLGPQVSSISVVLIILPWASLAFLASNVLVQEPSGLPLVTCTMCTIWGGRRGKGGPLPRSSRSSPAPWPSRGRRPFQDGWLGAPLEPAALCCTLGVRGQVLQGLLAGWEDGDQCLQELLARWAQGSGLARAPGGVWGRGRPLAQPPC